MEPAVAAGRLNVFDWVFFTLVAVVTTAGPWLREAGALGFGTFFVCSLLYAMMHRTLFELNWFAAFTAFGMLYVMLSYWDVLPTAWTAYHDGSVIPMQAAFVWSFHPILSAFRAFFTRALRCRQVGWLFATLLSLNLLVSPVLEWMLVPPHLQEGGILALAFSNLMNSETAMLLALAHLTMALRHRILMVVSVAFILASVFLDFSLQIYITFAMYLALHLRALSRWAFVGALLAFSLACAVGPLLVEMSDLAQIDRNTAIRGYMWADGIDLFLETYGVGVGFGRELVSNVYLSMDIVSFYDDADVLMGGIHNSFISMFARLGLIGGTLFLLAFLKAAWPSDRPGPMRESAFFAFFMAYVGAWVNVAVESPLAAVGTALLLGYVMAVRDLTNVPDALMRDGVRHA